jgi:hypothetical protein
MIGLTRILFAGLILLTISSGASAWYCRATGYGGSGWGRSDSYDRAKYLALYQCSIRGRRCRIEACIR